MKKLISFLCAICLALSAMPVFAALRYQYGALVASATMEGSTTTYITNHNNGGFDLGRTTELSHTGDYSYYIDTKSPAAATDIEYTQQFSVDISNLKNNKLYLEMYTTYNQASVWYYSDGTLVTTEALYVEDADENGWRKCWRIIESNNYDADSISISSFYRYSADDGLTKLYYDDYSVRLLPMRISADNITSNTSTFSLDEINVTGYDSLGVGTKIMTTDLFKHTVGWGDAYIDSNNNLVYTGDGDGSVMMQCEFFGYRAQYTVNFEFPVTVGDVTEKDGTYTVQIDNGSNKNIETTLCVVLYDGDRLALVNTQTTIAEKGKTTKISCKKPEIPYYVKSPTIKTYVLN